MFFPIERVQDLYQKFSKYRLYTISVLHVCPLHVMSLIYKECSLILHLIFTVLESTLKLQVGFPPVFP